MDKFIFGFVILYGEYPTVVVSYKEEWESEGCCSDHYSSEDWDKMCEPLLMDKLGMGEIMECYWDYSLTSLTKEDVKEALEKVGMIYDSEFEKIIQEEE